MEVAGPRFKLRDIREIWCPPQRRDKEGAPAVLDMCQSLSWPVLHGYSLESLGSCAAAAQTVWQRSKAQISRRPFKRNEEVFIVHFMLSMTHKLTCRY